jgi:DNA-binding MarR family transcriptional regulator
VTGRTANLLGALSQTVVDGQIASIGSATGLGESAAAALVTIGHAPGESIDFLRRVLRRSHSSVVRLVAELERRGLARKGTGKDARAVTLELTAKGRRTTRELLAQRRRVLEQCLAELSAEEQRLIDRVLAKLLGALVEDEMNAFQICRLCDGETCDPCPIEETFAASSH